MSIIYTQRHLIGNLAMAHRFPYELLTYRSVNKFATPSCFINGTVQPKKIHMLTELQLASSIEEYILRIFPLFRRIRPLRILMQ